jgi:hypothetical protein
MDHGGLDRSGIGQVSSLLDELRDPDVQEHHAEAAKDQEGDPLCHHSGSGLPGETSVPARHCRCTSGSAFRNHADEESRSLLSSSATRTVAE